GLETRVDNYQAAEGQSPAERLRGDQRGLEEKAAVLAEIKRNPEFSTLPAKSQEYVNERLDELQAYVAYLKKLQRGRQPSDASSDEEVEKIEEMLRMRAGDGLAVPREEWSQTRAARLRDERLEDTKLLRRAVEQAEEAYQQKKHEGERLWTLADYQPKPDAS